MTLQKRLQTQTKISAWTYDEGIYKGISVGAYDGKIGSAQSLINVESVNSAEGIVNRIVINKDAAEKFGFIIVEN